jgi:hypothetical protein
MPDLPPLVLNTAFADPAYLQYVPHGRTRYARFVHLMMAFIYSPPCAAHWPLLIPASHPFPVLTQPLPLCWASRWCISAGVNIQVDPLILPRFQAGLRQGAERTSRAKKSSPSLQAKPRPMN